MGSNNPADASPPNTAARSGTAIMPAPCTPVLAIPTNNPTRSKKANPWIVKSYEKSVNSSKERNWSLARKVQIKAELLIEKVVELQVNLANDHGKVLHPLHKIKVVHIDREYLPKVVRPNPFFIALVQVPEILQ